MAGSGHEAIERMELERFDARYLSSDCYGGNAAIMLEKNRDHSYSLDLGSLAPAEDCLITLRYAQILQFEQRGLRLLIPTVIAPRFGDPVRDGGLSPHQAPAHELIAEYPFDLQLDLHGDLANARVLSPSHPISITRDSSSTGGVLTEAPKRRRDGVDGTAND